MKAEFNSISDLNVFSELEGLIEVGCVSEKQREVSETYIGESSGFVDLVLAHCRDNGLEIDEVTLQERRTFKLEESSKLSQVILNHPKIRISVSRTTSANNHDTAPSVQLCCPHDSYCKLSRMYWKL